MEEFGGEIIIGLLIVTLGVFIFVGGLLIGLLLILVFFDEKFEDYVITSENKKAIKKLKKDQKEG